MNTVFRIKDPTQDDRFCYWHPMARPSQFTAPKWIDCAGIVQYSKPETCSTCNRPIRLDTDVNEALK